MRNLEMKYYNVYYFCNIIDNLLHLFVESIDWAPTGAQFTDSFFEGEQENFPKYSVLHEFCEFAIRTVTAEDDNKAIEEIQERYNALDVSIPQAKRLQIAYNQVLNSGPQLEVDRILKQYGKGADSFFKFLLQGDCTCIGDDYLEFTSINCDFDNAVLQMSRELFYVLFQNRNFLFRFNWYLARANPKKQKRCTIPLWVKRTVKFRDHGKCVLCKNDLSGLLDFEDDASVHFDHIVSLNEGGLNDVSNIQLMCSKCNLSKSGTSTTSDTYHDWYDF